MKNKKCKYPKCDCKLETFVCDNSNDFNVPHAITEFTQTVYKRIICKYDNSK